MDKSGKVITIFLVIFVILLISLTAISMFFFQKETELRKSAEMQLEQVRVSVAKLGADAKYLREQNYLLQEKSKEADEKINSLLDDVELEQGLREELKVEVQNLKEALSAANQAREKMEAELRAAAEQSRKEKDDLAVKLSAEEKRSKELDALQQSLQSKISELERSLGIAPSSGGAGAAEENIKLEKIVISPLEGEGRVLSVDAENEFIIFSLGEKNGLSEGVTVSVYRDDQYLGDAKITRVQPEMSAADFIPPLAGRDVQKNDRVIIKK
ncbi:MAG: hypothetical protein WC552_07810 [Candidatus Omnitrophota bacterium]